MESLIKLDWWYDRLVECNVHHCPKILIGTKLDLAEIEEKSLTVDKLVIEEFLRRHSEKDYFLTSSKENINIIHIFKEIIKKLFDFNNLDYEKIV